MRYYITLRNVEYDLECLTPPQSEFIAEIVRYYKGKPRWNKFANRWVQEGKKIWNGMTRKDVVRHPTFKICQDLESRLGIEQGYVRQTNYKDELLDIIEQYRSRYQFCKKMGISETFLSHILNGRKNFSITKLEELLDKLGYEITFTKKQAVHKV